MSKTKPAPTAAAEGVIAATKREWKPPTHDASTGKGGLYVKTKDGRDLRQRTFATAEDKAAAERTAQSGPEPAADA